MNAAYIGPELDLIPAPGSFRFELSADDLQQHYIETAALKCCYCSEPLGFSNFLLRWPGNINAHVGCHENSIEHERAAENNPHLIEQAATANKMTIEGFRSLPSYARSRLIRELKEASR